MHRDVYSRKNKSRLQNYALFRFVSFIFIFVKLSSSEQVFFLLDKLKYFPTQPEENQVVHESICDEIIQEHKLWSQIDLGLPVY